MGIVLGSARFLNLESSLLGCFGQPLLLTNFNMEGMKTIPHTRSRSKTTNHNIEESEQVAKIVGK